MKKLLLAVLLFSSFSMAACSNTWRGMGQDIERTGRAMQR